MSDEITIPELNTITTIQEDDAIMLTHSNGVTEKIAASNLTSRDTFIIAATPTVTGPTLGTGFAVRIYFTAAVTGLNGSSAMVINYNNTDYNVKVAKDGALVNFVAQEFTENNVTVYKYLQDYTVLELFYNGTDFVIVGNPIVLSGNDYKIYADGSKLVDTVAVDNMNSVTSNAVASKFNTTIVAYTVASSSVNWTLIKLPTGDYLGLGWNKSQVQDSGILLVSPSGYTLKEIINGDAFQENYSGNARRAMHKSSGSIYMYMDNGTYKIGSIRVQALFSKNS